MDPANQVLNGKGVRIKAGDMVFLDMSPPALTFLWVEGDLVFDPCHGDMELAAAAILVEETGNLQIGLPSYDYPVQATITLTTAQSPPTVAEWTDLESNHGFSVSQEVKDALDARGLVVAGGELRLYGKSLGVAFEKLGGTVPAGATTVDAPSVMAVSAGDKILFTPTGFDHTAGETRVITQISSPPPPLSLQWTTGLATEHYADSTPQSFAPSWHGTPAPDWEVQEQGEIAVLERNITIRGEDPSLTGNFGHVIVIKDSGGGLPLVQVRWAAFEELGDFSAPGRYPLHVHKLGDTSTLAEDSFIKHALVDGGEHHGIVIHDTDGMEVHGNVVHDIKGYGIYLQGESMSNLITDNLVHGGFRATECCLTQGEVSAGFNIKNPQNTVTGNIATGFHDYGFYLVPVDGFAGTEPVVFTDNEAHSIGDIGFFQNTLAGTDDVEYVDLFAWKCRRYGAWIRSLKKYTLKDSVFADCRAGFYPASEGIRDAGDGEQVIQDCLFVGVTNNDGDGPAQVEEYDDGHQLKWDVVTGIEIYDGLVRIENCRFAEFEDLARSSGSSYPEDFSLAAGLTQVAKYSTWAIDPRNSVKELEFGDNVDREAYFRTSAAGDNQIAFTTLVDLDDSLGNGANLLYFPIDTSFLGSIVSGTSLPDTSSASEVNAKTASLASSPWCQALLSVQTAGPQTPLTTEWFHVTNPGGAEVLGASWYSDSVPLDPGAGGDGKNKFPINLPAADATSVGSFLPFYRIAYDPVQVPAGSEPRELEVAMRFPQAAGDFVIVEIPYPVAKPGPSSEVLDGAFVEKLSFSSLLNASESTGAQYYYDTATETLVLRIVAGIEASHSADVEGTEQVVILTVL